MILLVELLKHLTIKYHMETPITTTEEINWNQISSWESPFSNEDVQASLEILDEVLNFSCSLPEHKVHMLKRFIKHYQSLNEHKDMTCGLWATDNEKLAKEKGFFKIKFQKKYV
jgi:hypothetical protein